MKRNLFQNPISGIITPLLTPFSTDGSVDFQATEKLVEHVIEGGVSGIFVLGTTGEGPCINLEDRFEIIRRVIEFTAERVPVLVGITDAAYDNSVRLARCAEDTGADALVVTPPPYFTSTQTEILKYFESLSGVTKLPSYLYNIPSLTRALIEPSTVALASALPQIIGIKDSSGNMIYFNKLKQALQEKKDLTFYMGPEELLVEACALGAQGGVHGGSNLFPELYVQLYEAAMNRDYQRIDILRRIVIKISTRLYSLSGNENHCIRVVKYLLSKWGFCNETMAVPYSGLNEETKGKADTHFEDILNDLAEAGIHKAKASVLT
jgi:4-hydroxy-tetrahydrodipicolinate synthase